MTGDMHVYLCAYSLLISHNVGGNQADVHVRYFKLSTFSSPERTFSRETGRSTLVSTQNILGLRFPHIPRVFTARQLLAFAAQRGEHQKKKKIKKRKKGKEEIARRVHPCARRRLPFLVFLKKYIFFSRVSSPSPRRCFSPDFLRMPRVKHHHRFVCETVLTRRDLPRCDIIENKIRTHLLLGQSYPCCQSRCHTHTTLTSTPKSDIVCWNRPSLWLFSRAQRLLLDHAACR